MTQTMIIVVTALISAAAFIPVGILIRKKTAESKIKGAEIEANKIVTNAKREAESIKKEEILKAKEEIIDPVKGLRMTYRDWTNMPDVWRQR